MTRPLSRTKSNKSQQERDNHNHRVKRMDRVVAAVGVKAKRKVPVNRGVARNRTFKFKSSTFVAQRKSNDVNEFYHLEQELNEGAYGVVYRATNRENGAERAVKKIEKSKWDDIENQKVIDEFNVLKGLDHPNILKMYELFEEEKHFYIVTDICKGGDLLDELEALEETGCFLEQDAAVLINQVLSGVNYCHRNNIVHRDLKPENVLLEQNKDLNEIKLIDFGFAVPCDANTKLHEQKGTAAYMSPQAMLEEPYGQKTDVWGVGVIAYIVLAGFNPFEGHTDQETAVLVEMGEFDFDIPEWKHISDDAKDFVTKCLQYEEKDRPTAAEALQHPWINNCRSSINTDFYRTGGDACVAALNNLQKFNAQSKLKQATYTFIASQLLLKEEKETIDKLFRSMDTSGDGKLGKHEVKIGYKNLFGEDLSEEELDSLFQQVDMNGNGVIEYSEFVVAAMKEENLLTTDNLKKAFAMFDYDKDGFISRNDLRQVLNFFKSSDDPESVEDHIIDKIMNQVDTDGNGQIDFNEFKDIMFDTAILPDQTSPPADAEDELFEQAKRNTSKMSDDDGSTASGKLRRTGAALHIPRRRRRSSAAEKLVLAHMAEDTKAKLEEIDRAVNGTVSGSSQVSNLSGLSADAGDDTATAGAADDDTPAKPAPYKKKITRTKSGFMTQRAEPSDPKRAAAMAKASQPRQGRKKGDPVPATSPTTNGGPAKQKRQSMSEIQQEHKEAMANIQKGYDKKKSEKAAAPKSPSTNLFKKSAVTSPKKLENEAKSEKGPFEKKMDKRPSDKKLEKRSSSKKLEKKSSSKKLEKKISSKKLEKEENSSSRKLENPPKTPSASSKKLTKPSALTSSSKHSVSSAKKPSEVAQNRTKRTSDDDDDDDSSSSSSSSSSPSSSSSSSSSSGSDTAAKRDSVSSATSKRPSWALPKRSVETEEEAKKKQAELNRLAVERKKKDEELVRAKKEREEVAKRVKERNGEGKKNTEAELKEKKKRVTRQRSSSLGALDRSKARNSGKEKESKPNFYDWDKNSAATTVSEAKKSVGNKLADLPETENSKLQKRHSDNQMNGSASVPGTPIQRNSIRDRMNAFSGAPAKPASDASSLTAKRLEGLNPNSTGSVKDRMKNFKGTGTFLPTNKARSPKKKSTATTKASAKSQSNAVRQKAKDLSAPSLEDDGTTNDDLAKKRSSKVLSTSSKPKTSSTSKASSVISQKAKDLSTPSLEDDGTTNDDLAKKRSSKVLSTSSKPKTSSTSKASSVVSDKSKAITSKSRAVDALKPLKTERDRRRESLYRPGVLDTEEDKRREDLMSASIHTVGGETWNGDEKESAVRRSSFSNGSDAPTATRRRSSASEKLRERMKLFEKNIKKNEDLGVRKKALW